MSKSIFDIPLLPRDYLHLDLESQIHCDDLNFDTVSVGKHVGKIISTNGNNKGIQNTNSLPDLSKNSTSNMESRKRKATDSLQDEAPASKVNNRTGSRGTSTSSDGLILGSSSESNESNLGKTRPRGEKGKQELLSLLLLHYFPNFLVIFDVNR